MQDADKWSGIIHPRRFDFGVRERSHAHLHISKDYEMLRTVYTCPRLVRVVRLSDGYALLLGCQACPDTEVNRAAEQPRGAVLLRRHGVEWLPEPPEETVLNLRGGGREHGEADTT